MRSAHTSAAPEARSHRLETEPLREAVTRLGDTLGACAPLLVITGEPGVGKSWLLRDLAEQWGSLARLSLAPATAAGDAEFLGHLLRGFGVEPPAGAASPQLRDRLERVISQEEAAGRAPVIAVDDAHALPDELLRELQTLAIAAALAYRPLVIVLVGKPSVEQRLATPEFEFLRQRIAVRYNVEPFTAQETRQYLDGLAAGASERPLSFSRKACREIHERTRGVPRDVAALAEASLRRAHAAGSAVVNAEHVTGTAPDPAGEAAPATPTAAAEPAEAAEAWQATDDPPAAAEPATAPPVLETASPDPSPVAPEPAPGSHPAEPRDTAEHDPRVRDWVGRFIGPDEPRFGDLLRAPVPFVDEAERTREIREMVARGGPVVVPPRAGRRPRAVAPARDRRGRAVAGGSRERHAIVVLGVLLVAMSAVTLVLLLERRGPARAPESVPVQVARATAPAAPAHARSPVRRTDAAARAPSVAPVPKAVPTKPPAATPAVGQFALDIGVYAVREQAEAERDRIVAATSLKGWVVEAAPETGGGYHIILGIFSTRERAAASAQRMELSGLATGAEVIPLPPRRVRQ